MDPYDFYYRYGHGDPAADVAAYDPAWEKRLPKAVRNAAKTPKYAPAREDGTKPWFAEIYCWGRVETRIVWAHTAADARHNAINRMRYTTAKVRRATPEDVEAERG